MGVTAILHECSENTGNFSALRSHPEHISRTNSLRDDHWKLRHLKSFLLFAKLQKDMGTKKVTAMYFHQATCAYQYLSHSPSLLPTAFSTQHCEHVACGHESHIRNWIYFLLFLYTLCWYVWMLFLPHERPIKGIFWKIFLKVNIQINDVRI